MPYFFLNDFHMYYVKKGEGIPVVFIHGLGSNHKIWSHQISSLKKQFTVLAADNRYHGLSTKDVSHFQEYEIEQLAKDWIGLLKSQMDRKVYIVGLSMGSAIALSVSLECPELVSGLILLEPWASCDDEHRSRLENWIEMLTNEWNVKHFAEVLAQYYFSPSFIRDSPERIKAYEEIRKEQSLFVNLQDCKACLSFDIRERLRLKKIKVPTALLYGELDILIPPYHSRLLKREIPNIVEFRIKDCGHMPFIECSEDFNRMLIQFVEGCEEGEIRNEIDWNGSRTYIVGAA